MLAEFIELSPAKLNLFLKIIKKRNDGYHNLMGMTNLMSGNAEKGVEYFEKVVNQSNIYLIYGSISLGIIAFPIVNY